VTSRFVYSTINGMFIAELATWLTTPIDSAAMELDPPAFPSVMLLSRANYDPGKSLDAKWEAIIPSQAQTERATFGEMKVPSRRDEGGEESTLECHWSE
jgi:hypothetical protein